MFGECPECGGCLTSDHSFISKNKIKHTLICEDCDYEEFCEYSNVNEDDDDSEYEDDDNFNSVMFPNDDDGSEYEDYIEDYLEYFF